MNDLTPWFIATNTFTQRDGDKWERYIKWSSLTQLDEVVSLDGMLCPPILREIKDEYWEHIVNEDFMLDFFVNYDFLVSETAGLSEKRNLLCVFRNPTRQPPAPSFADFEFLGYDLVDRQGSNSALTNCGGFPDVFANSELSRKGLLESFERAVEVQQLLRSKHPEEHHADCHRWAIFRALTAPAAANR